MSDVTVLGKPAVPADLGTAVLFDSTADTGTGTTLARRRAFADIDRAEVGAFVNQAMTFKLDMLEKDSTTWRTINGAGAGEVVAASTYFSRDNLVVSGFDDFRLILVAGATAPTTWEVTTKLIRGDRAAGV